MCLCIVRDLGGLPPCRPLSTPLSGTIGLDHCSEVRPWLCCLSNACLIGCIIIIRIIQYVLRWLSACVWCIRCYEELDWKMLGVILRHPLYVNCAFVFGCIVVWLHRRSYSGEQSASSAACHWRRTQSQRCKSSSCLTPYHSVISLLLCCCYPLGGGGEEGATERRQWKWGDMKMWRKENCRGLVKMPRWRMRDKSLYRRRTDTYSIKAIIIRWKKNWLVSTL